jgi:hypothetical protein
MQAPQPTAVGVVKTMDAARRSIVEQQSAMAHAQMMAQQQAQRSSSYFAPSPMLAAQASLSGYLPLQTMMQTPPMVAVAKLANSKGAKNTNSTLVVRSSVPRFNVAGGLYSVAQWARKCVEDNLEWIVKLIRRHHVDEQVVMLAYGDGCQTIVLLDDAINQMPDDIDMIPKIGIGVSSAPKGAKDDEDEIAKDGVLQPTDSVWDHLRFEQQNEAAAKDKKGNILFIHTSMTVYGQAADGRRRVLQVKTLAPKKPLEAVQYVPNPIFEQQLLAKWKGMAGGMTPEQIQRVSMAMMQGMIDPHPAMDMATAAAHSASMKEDEGTLITFNPKELILLEKAFDNKLTNRDLKSKADKWSEDDKKNCQLVIKRANDEFKWVVVRKRKTPAAVAPANGGPVSKKKKVTKVADGSVDKKPEARKSTKEKKRSTASKESKKNTSEKAAPKESPNEKIKEDEVALPAADSDDEPISKLKEKKDAAKKIGNAASAKRRKSKGSPVKAANQQKGTTEKKESKLKAQSPKKRGRNAKKEPTPTKKMTRRSTSKSKRSRM